jgi:hypothetical protein
VNHPAATNNLKTLARYTAQLLLVYPLTLIAGIPLFLLLSKLGIDGNLGHGASALARTCPGLLSKTDPPVPVSWG